MAERPRVLVDQDMVLADFDAGVLEQMTRRFPRVPLLATRTHLDIADDYQPEHATLIRQLTHEKGFVAGLPPVDGAVEGWELLLDLGYHPQVCTSPMRANPYSTPEKRAWLGRHFAKKFGEWVVQEAILDRNKYCYNGVALIDDRPQLAHADKAAWRQIIFDQEYNRDVTGLRIVSWQDPRLPEVLKTAKGFYRPPAVGG